MGKPLKNERKVLINRIKRKIPISNEINAQIERFEQHLNRDDLNTLENYPEKKVIEAIMESYPDKLNKSDVNAITQHKVNKFMCLLYDEMILKRRKLHVNPLIIKMFKNHICGKDDDSNMFQGQQFVIQNFLEPAKTGVVIEAEPKTIIDNNSH